MIFCAKDKAVFPMLLAYMDACEKLGCGIEHLESLAAMHTRVLNFQQNIESRVPDTETDCEIDRCIGGNNLNILYKKEIKDDRYMHRPKLMRGLCKRAGIEPHFGFHQLRHLMSSLLNDDPKVATKTIQNILGHATQKTTEIYLHKVEGAMEDAMDSISGKFIENPQNGNQKTKRVSTKC